MRNFVIAFCGGALGLGVALSGYFLGSSIERQKIIDTTMRRTVTVKGIAERVVKANQAYVRLSFTEGGHDLEELKLRGENHQKILIETLKEIGFLETEITPENFSLRDEMLSYSGIEKDKNKFRYVLNGGIFIASSKIDLVAKIQQHYNTLFKKGIVVEGEPRYSYDNLDALRPEMIAEATHSARRAANQFANDSKAHIGGISNAQQGLFTISGKDAFGNWETYNESRSIEKKIRVVSTIQFFIQD